MKPLLACLLGAAAVVPTVSGCAHKGSSAPTARAKGATMSAVSAITEARCDREQRCGNIGMDKKYATHDACVEKTRADWDDDLNAYECPQGVNEQQLAACLSDMRDEDCGASLDRLTSAMSCRSSEICQ